MSVDVDMSAVERAMDGFAIVSSSAVFGLGQV